MGTKNDPTLSENTERMAHFRDGLKASCQESLQRSRRDTSWSFRVFNRENCLCALIFCFVWVIGGVFRVLVTPGATLGARLQDHGCVLHMLILALFLLFLHSVLSTDWKLARPIPRLREFLLVAITLSLEFASVYIVFRTKSIPTDQPWQIVAAMPLALFPALLINLLDARAATCTAICEGILLPLQFPTAPGTDNYLLFCFALVTAMSAVPCFRDIRMRVHYLTHGLYQGVLIALICVVFCLATENNGTENWRELLQKAALPGIAQGVLTGLVCMVLLPLFELAFRIPTPMTLAELTDVNTPLLQRLRNEAPGTYQHSLDVAEMATNAAALIGADDKLVHVMALYHDVGKLFAPQYFAENMGVGQNPLENSLSPEESANLIFEHTIHGAQLAAKYRISPLIVPAIRQHHGNTLLEHFYRKACKEAEANAQPMPAEADFRYPQKPTSSREVAILAMADSCEAAVRALLSQKPDLNLLARKIVSGTKDAGEDATTKCADILSENLQRQENMTTITKAIDERIASVFRARFNDHQLDAVPLSTQELALMARSFRETILFHFHTRPEYRTAQ